MCANFQSKWTALNFSAQICPKKDLGFEIEKNNVGIRINIVKTLCVSIFSQAGQLFWPKFAQKMDLGSEIQKTNFGIGIQLRQDAKRNKNQLRQDAIRANFQEKRTILTFSAQICPKMDFGVGILKI